MNDVHIAAERAMLKTIVTLFRGAAFRAEEEFVDRGALLILDQQIRDAAAGIDGDQPIDVFNDEIDGLHNGLRLLSVPPSS